MSHKDIIVRNPFFVRPYQHVLECLNGYLLLAMRQYENKQKYAGCYNFGPLEKDCINTGDLVDLFCKAWPEEITWRDCSDNGPRESTYLSLDITKARTTIQWRPVLNIQKAVDLVVEWVIECSRGRDVNDIMNQQIDTFFNQLLATTSKEQQES